MGAFADNLLRGIGQNSGSVTRGLTAPSFRASTGAGGASTGSGGSAVGTVVRGLLKPLEIIDTPRRAVISGVRELVDAIDSDPTTRASFSDFREQAGDPTYGFGTAFPDPTGNSWINRAIGFAGDVALDPLTYLTLGAGRFAGMAGRAALSTDLLRAAQAVDRVDEARPLIRAVGQRGVTGLDRTQRGLVDDLLRVGREAGAQVGEGVGQAGLRLNVPFTSRQSGAIPGTRRVAEAIGGNLAGVRQAAAGTRAGAAIRGRLAPEQLRPLYDNLATGGGPNDVVQELAVASARRSEEAARNATQSALLREADEITREGKREGLSADELTRRLENRSSVNPEGADGRAAMFLNENFELIEDAADGSRANYAPWMRTEQGRQLGRDVDDLNATIGVVDELAPEGIVLRREAFRPGQVLERNGVTYVLPEQVTVDVVNDAMKTLYPELGGANFLIDDGYDLLNRWARAAAAERGRREFAAALERFGIAVPRDARTQALQFAEGARAGAVGSAARQAPEIVSARDVALEAAQRASEDSYQQLSERVSEQIDRGRRAAARLGGRAERRMDDIYRRMERQIDALDDRIADTQRRAAGVDGAVSAGSATPQEAGFLRSIYEREIRDLEDLKAGVGDPETDEVIDGLLAESRRLAAEADSLARGADELAGSFDAVSSGAVVDEVLRENQRTGPAARRFDAARRSEQQARESLEAAKAEGFLSDFDPATAELSLRQNLDAATANFGPGSRQFRGEAEALLDGTTRKNASAVEKRLAKLTQDARRPDALPEVVAAHRTLVDAYRIEAVIAAEGGQARNFAGFWDVGKRPSSPQARAAILDALQQGWRDIERTGVVVPEQVYRMRQRLVALNDPKEWNGFLRVWEQYTRLFKAYVTASPRFHVRNAMSATFMNYSDGVTNAQMARGIRIWNKYAKSGLDSLDDTERRVIDAVLASGAGQYDTVELGVRAPRGTGWSRKVGRNVEGAVRAGPALATIEAGGSFDEALARVIRLHFNYSDMSSADRVARQVFPFWTFMSRNLPLQFTQIWSKPRSYQRFNAIVRNIRTDDEEQGVVPGYFTEGGGFRLPGLLATAAGAEWARPDLGFSRLDEDVDRLSDPVRFLADANPLIKAAVENFAGKQLYKDIPLDDESFVPVEGWQRALIPLLLATGQAEQGPNGVVITPKTEYLLDQLAPQGGLLNRYAGEGSRNEGDALRNLYSFTGLPALLSLGGYTRELTPDKQAGELYRRRIEQREALDRLRAIAQAS